MIKKILVTASLLALTNAWGQTAADPIKLGDVTFTATLRSRVYAWDWFQAPSAYDNEYGYSGNLLRLNFAQKKGAFDWDAEVAVPFFLGLPEHATAPAPQGA